ncbi:acetyltransferase [Nannochloropsis oceanica]
MKVEVDFYRENEYHVGWALLNKELEEGRSWPFWGTMSFEEFRAYFLSHNAFVVRAVKGGGEACVGAESNGKEGVEGDEGASVLGTYYIKPNFPDRCAHICNGGLITEERMRGHGVGTVMALSFLRIAKDLGYKASYFNLVFATNTVSIALWEKTGFRRLATIPAAARLKGEESLVDAYMYHYDLTTYTELGPLSLEDAAVESRRAIEFS